jgi:hypothetical protein
MLLRWSLVVVLVDVCVVTRILEIGNKWREKVQEMKGWKR